ncbi:MAG: isochorismatase family protein, partial [Planctomycetota bacterium]
DLDSYSALFSDGHRRRTGLDGLLKAAGVDTVYICGLALNVCVHATALDACKLGFETFVIRDATRGVEIEPGAVEQAEQEIREAGAKFVQADQVPLEGDYTPEAQRQADPS